jgi:hypothetical protein
LRKFILIIFFSVAYFTFCQAQYGKFFLSHHQAAIVDNNVFFDIAQDNNGLIYVASKSGILEFDGTDWSLIKTPGAIYTIAIEDNEIYVAGRAGFGFLKRNAFNQQEYQSLSDEVSHYFEVTQSLLADDYIYFLSANVIYTFDRTSLKIKYEAKSSNEFGELISIFQINNKIYIQTEHAGLKKFEDGRFTENDLSFPLKSEIIFVDRLKNSENYIIYMASDSLLLVQNNITRWVNPIDTDYLRANVVIGGVYVSNDLLALATIRGGVVFINPLTGGTVQILNNQSGLPDNEIMTINSDLQSSIWVAHSYGFTRIMPGLPIRSFSHYPGLEGNLIVAKTFHDKIFVGTSLGLYRLDKVEKYDEVIDYIKHYPKTSTSAIDKVQEDTPSKEDVKEIRKRGLLSFLKKKNIPENEEEEAVVDKSESPKQQAIVQKRVRRQLRSIDYKYEAVAQISGKINQLIPIEEKLLASGTAGLYFLEANGLSTYQLTGLPIRYAYYHPKENVIFAATYYNDILSFEKQNDTWIPSNIFDDFKEYIVHIFADKEDRIWFSGLDRIYWIYLKNLSVLDMDEIYLDNPYLKQAYGISAKDEVYFLNRGGLSKYIVNENKLLETLPEITLSRAIPDLNEIWMSTKGGWFNFGAYTVAPQAQKFLNIFKGISHINRNSIENEIWIITNDNELYRYNTLEPFENESYFPLLIKQIRFQEQPIILKSRYSIEQHEVGISVSFVQPDFSGLMAVEYRYKLEGSGMEWSEWSKANNLANFTFLPVGDYELLFESRDAFGAISSAEPIFIHIDPPYWRQTWFYAIEVGVFLILVLLSIRLNQYGKRYRLLSRLLTFLTIVIFIEFIQTLAEDQFATEKSPVIDFLIQVSVAFMILPIESYLRTLMLRQDSKAFRLSLNLKRNKSQNLSEHDE